VTEGGSDVVVNDGSMLKLDLGEASTSAKGD
jgi:hypothetical protein